MPLPSRSDEQRCYDTRVLARRQFISRPEARRRAGILIERDIGARDADGRACFNADELERADAIFGVKKVKRANG